MHGIDKDMSVAFVHPEDRELPVDEQTIFYLKPVMGNISSRIQAKYISAIRTERRGRQRWEAKQIEEGRQFEWLQKIAKVENFKFPPSMIKKYSRYADKDKCNSKGYFKLAESEEDRLNIYFSIPAYIQDDIMDKAGELSTVTEIDKKKSK